MIHDYSARIDELKNISHSLGVEEMTQKYVDNFNKDVIISSVI